MVLAHETLAPTAQAVGFIFGLLAGMTLASIGWWVLL